MTSGLPCTANWYCWDGGAGTSLWSDINNWTDLSSASGSNPSNITTWSSDQFKVGAGYNTILNAAITSNTFGALENSGNVTVSSGGPVRFGSLTLPGVGPGVAGRTPA
jgi:hypothetical protein